MWTAIVLLAVIGLSVFFWWQNNGLTISEYIMRSAALPPAMENLKLVHLSDLHNKSFGAGQKKLVDGVRKLCPDVIVITGDLIDKRRTKENRWENAVLLVRNLVQVAPVYFVSGNHEWQAGHYEAFRLQLEAVGAMILDNRTELVSRGEDHIALIGLADESSEETRSWKKSAGRKNTDLDPKVEQVLKERLQALCARQEPYFQILLTHRPRLIQLFAELEVQLVCCGHAHGGQARLPILGGIYAPDQGFRPAYAEGVQVVENTVVEINRGLGNSGFPFRFLNRPEIVAMTLKTDEEAPGDLEPEEESTPKEMSPGETATGETLPEDADGLGERAEDALEPREQELLQTEAQIQEIPLEEPEQEPEQAEPQPLEAPSEEPEQKPEQAEPQPQGVPSEEPEQEPEQVEPQPQGVPSEEPEQEPEQVEPQPQEAPSEEPEQELVQEPESEELKNKS